MMPMHEKGPACQRHISGNQTSKGFGLHWKLPIFVLPQVAETTKQKVQPVCSLAPYLYTTPATSAPLLGDIINVPPPRTSSAEEGILSDV